VSNKVVEKGSGPREKRRLKMIGTIVIRMK
jgi:hypothetical protein